MSPIDSDGLKKENALLKSELETYKLPETNKHDESTAIESDTQTKTPDVIADVPKTESIEVTAEPVKNGYKSADELSDIDANPTVTGAKKQQYQNEPIVQLIKGDAENGANLVRAMGEKYTLRQYKLAERPQEAVVVQNPETQEISEAGLFGIDSVEEMDVYKIAGDASQRYGLGVRDLVIEEEASAVSPSITVVPKAAKHTKPDEIHYNESECSRYEKYTALKGNVIDAINLSNKNKLQAEGGHTEKLERSKERYPIITEDQTPVKQFNMPFSRADIQQRMERGRKERLEKLNADLWEQTYQEKKQKRINELNSQHSAGAQNEGGLIAATQQTQTENKNPSAVYNDRIWENSAELNEQLNSMGFFR